MADATTQLDQFLDSTPPDAAQEAPQTPEAPPAGEPQAEPDKPPTEAPAPAEPQSEPEDGQQTGAVPAAVLAKARNDWKAKTAELEGQLAEVRRQLAEAKQPPAPQPVPQGRTPLPPIPDRQADPAGYIHAMNERIIDQHLNTSQMLMEQKIGVEATRKLQDDFLALAQQDPTLVVQARAAVNPYEFARQHVEQTRLIAEMNGDPAAYRARLRSEIEAELRAQGLGQQPVPAAPAISPAAGMPPSLASVRSAAPRGAPAWTGPDSMEQIIAGVPGRKRG
jgi:hypothetical protein